MVGQRNGIRGKITIAIAVLLLLTLAREATAQAIYPSGSQGYDMSFPQCDLPYPAVTNPSFAVVGVTSGHAFRDNPCFASQYAWAATGPVNAQAVYLNLNEDIGVTGVDGDTGPYGPCGADDTCHALNYGYNAAGSAYAYATQEAKPFAATLWWLDIETENSWAESDLDRNRAIIAGAVRFLQEERGYTVGVYSTAAMWQEITGGWQNGMPVWVGGATEEDAQTGCGTGFTGGPVYLVQYETGDYDEDIAC